jgi:mono/diheme cytochrome c family protein
MIVKIVRPGHSIDLHAIMTILTVKSFRTFAVLVALAAPFASHADDAATKKLDVKNTFRNICGFCHEDYGRRAAKGPQLMNTARSDEFIFNRVKNGFPGRMAAFGTVFTDDQIRDIIKFIRSLKPDEEPRNPS